MASFFPDLENDIFISYRQNDNKYDGWVAEFVFNLNKELEATIKEKITVYFDGNPHDGLLETHNVDKSLSNKLRSLIFIPVLSQTYCDTDSYAWKHEFLAFNNMALEDRFGRDITLRNGNVISRILPIRIHDLDLNDLNMVQDAVGGPLRSIDFFFRETGVNRPLRPDDQEEKNFKRTSYRNQVNKLANSIKEILFSLQEQAAVGYRELLSKEKVGYVSPFVLSIASAALGKNEEAIRYLKAGLERHDPFLPAVIPGRPDNQNLLAIPESGKIMKAIGLK